MELIGFIFLLFLLPFCALAAEELNEEEFTEALLLRPLPDRKVLAHFHFETSAPPTRIYGRHHHIFPKSIYQLVHKFQIREMELSFTQGRWNYERWGGYDPISSFNAKPPGVELWADFDVPEDQVEHSWKNLTHALSGLFCASINFLEHSTSYSAPKWSFHSLSGKLRYGTLPREAVCTENLTPWLKLLPCRDKAGLAYLMDRPSIYRGYYHSQRLHLKSDEHGASESSSGMVLSQTLTVVLQPNSLGPRETLSGKTLQPSWSLSSLFGRSISSKCSLSKSGNVYVQFEKNLVSELNNLLKNGEAQTTGTFIHEVFQENFIFELASPPNRVVNELGSPHKEGSILYEFPVENYDEYKQLDVGLSWKVPVAWSSEQAPLRANRFLLGSGNERGGIAISLKSTGSNHVRKTSCEEADCWLRVYIFQVVPWYVKVYYHTLEVYVDGKRQTTSENIEKVRVSPSEDKISPGVMEMVLRLPAGVKTASLTLEFDKGFLHIDEYPPDANQGFDIPSAVISFTDFASNMNFGNDSSAKKVPLLSKLQEKSPVLSYTEVLLVPLTTPDFSMPYNVITITCTVFALYFGSLLNTLRRRVAEEERLLKSKASRKKGPLSSMLSKLYSKFRGKRPEEEDREEENSRPKAKLIAKVLVVAGIAVAWQFYSSSS